MRTLKELLINEESNVGEPIDLPEGAEGREHWIVLVVSEFGYYETETLADAATALFEKEFLCDEILDEYEDLRRSGFIDVIDLNEHGNYNGEVMAIIASPETPGLSGIILKATNAQRALTEQSPIHINESLWRQCIIDVCEDYWSEIPYAIRIECAMKVGVADIAQALEDDPALISSTQLLDEVVQQR